MEKYFTDMHCHMIFEVDDGSDSMETSMKMLEMARDEGVRRIIFTPHSAYGQGAETRALIENNFRILSEMALSRYPDMEFYLGSEIFYSSGTIDMLRDKTAITMAGSRYVLIEFTPDDDYDTVYTGTRKVVDEGFIPILAHIERYECLTRRQERVEELINLGAYIQVNADSFMLGRFNKTSAWVSRLLDEGLIHLVADDCHNTGSRKPLMKTVYDRLSKKHSVETLDDVFIHNAEKILTDEFI